MHTVTDQSCKVKYGNTWVIVPKPRATTTIKNYGQRGGVGVGCEQEKCRENDGFLIA